MKFDGKKWIFFRLALDLRGNEEYRRLDGIDRCKKKITGVSTLLRRPQQGGPLFEKN